jgi:hypothetical protein
MRIATRAQALVGWHEANGEDPPADGRYRFSGIDGHRPALDHCLAHLRAAGEIGIWREGLWHLLEELALYFGTLAFFQQEARPHEVDARFPAEALEATVGLDNALALYGALLESRGYEQWRAHRRSIRAVILAMQEQGRKRLAPEA